MVLGAQSAQQAHPESRFEVAALPSAAQISKRPGTVGVHEGTEFFGDLSDGLVPGNALEFPVHLLQRMVQPLAVVLVEGHVQSLAAGIPFAAGVILIRPHLDHPVVLHPYFKAAVLRAQHAGSFIPFAHGCSFGIILAGQDDTGGQQDENQPKNPGGAIIIQILSEHGEVLFVLPDQQLRSLNPKQARRSKIQRNRLCPPSTPVRWFIPFTMRNGFLQVVDWGDLSLKTAPGPFFLLDI
jgi:hypothetical protein